jgi:epoxyqueuosine reductase
VKKKDEKILLHICCAPCTIFPIKSLRNQNFEITGFFYNPNIHPYIEYKNRLDSVRILGEKENLPIEFVEDYNIESYLRAIVYHENRRCPTCYYLRIFETAKLAKKMGFETFTTTLLFTKFQQHETIKEIGNKIGKQLRLNFFYEDFRIGWDEGVKTSKEMGLYRQQYCGCIYSEKDRYYKKDPIKK